MQIKHDPILGTQVELDDIGQYLDPGFFENEFVDLKILKNHIWPDRVSNCVGRISNVLINEDVLK